MTSGTFRRFLEKLRGGCDLVMGNRFLGGIQPGAMPPLHRYLGNPVLSGIGRMFFRSPCGDFHCGLRGFSKAAIERLDLRTTGMEFASEMIVKATLHGLRLGEVPTTLGPTGEAVRRTSAVGATAGDTCGSCFYTVRAGYSCTPDCSSCSWAVFS